MEELMELLKKEYGIESESDLDEAISRLPMLDISIFVTEQNKGKLYRK